MCKKNNNVIQFRLEKLNVLYYYKHIEAKALPIV